MVEGLRFSAEFLEFEVLEFRVWCLVVEGFRFTVLLLRRVQCLRISGLRGLGLGVERLVVYLEVHK